MSRTLDRAARTALQLKSVQSMQSVLTLLAMCNAFCFAAPLGAQLRPGARTDSTRAPALAISDPARRKPAAASPAIARLVGEYGAANDTVIVLERDGRLIAWERGRETAVSAKEFSGAGALTLQLGARTLPRRAVGTEEGTTFRVTPLHPIDSLRHTALAATPPKEAPSARAAELVELTALDATIQLDIRYATANNFMGAPMYSSARAFLQRPAADAVVRAHRALAAYGFGILIHDAYRPWYVTRMFWDATTGADHEFVANPATGSRHNRGAAVDLTMYDRATGKPVRMTGGYDEFSRRSYADYPGGTALERWHRDLLRRVMEAQGFAVNPSEWWHFDYHSWRDYPILNIRFESLSVPR